ncbi:MAG TPA: helix-turn-helix domain-containing protein, partial [Polyangiaceae bacterium]|nr:helix-turn-helix domain-containing protein [Polyangiaceae bacterium]
ASNRDLEHMVELGTFREDLFYRINVVVVHLPPLSARGNDVLLLAQHFINRYAAATGKPVQGLSPAAAAALLHHHWPGNVRELGNCIERAVALTEHEQIVVEDLPEKLRKQDSQPVLPTSRCLEDLPPLSEIEKRYILWVYEAVGGSSSRAVQVLGMDRKTLYRRLQQYRVVPGSEPPGAT